MKKEKEKILHKATLCFFLRQNQVLLALKKKKIGAGLLNGYGGGIERGESPLRAARRECREECGLHIPTNDIREVAIMYFHNTTEEGEKFICKCHVFLVSDWKGIPKETKEMGIPQWFDLANLPISKMMIGDPYWVPQALCGCTFTGEVHYGPHQKTLLQPVVLHMVDHLP